MEQTDCWTVFKNNATSTAGVSPSHPRADQEPFATHSIGENFGVWQNDENWRTIMNIK